MAQKKGSGGGGKEESGVKLRKGREQLVVNEKMLTCSFSVTSLCAYTMSCFMLII